MSLDEIVEQNPTISRAEAIKELESHCADMQEFFDECGDKKEYKALAVLEWLGY